MGQSEHLCCFVAGITQDSTGSRIYQCLSQNCGRRFASTHVGHFSRPKPKPPLNATFQNRTNKRFDSVIPYGLPSVSMSKRFYTSYAFTSFSPTL